MWMCPECLYFPETLKARLSGSLGRVFLTSKSFLSKIKRPWYTSNGHWQQNYTKSSATDVDGCRYKNALTKKKKKSLFEALLHFCTVNMEKVVVYVHFGQAHICYEDVH